MFLPILAYLVCIPWLLFWTATATYMYSIGEPEFEANSFIANIKWEDTTWFVTWYLLFGLFWVVAFIICLQ